MKITVHLGSLLIATVYLGFLILIFKTPRYYDSPDEPTILLTNNHSRSNSYSNLSKLSNSSSNSGQSLVKINKTNESSSTNLSSISNMTEKDDSQVSLKHAKELQDFYKSKLINYTFANCLKPLFTLNKYKVTDVTIKGTDYLLNHGGGGVVPIILVKEKFLCRIKILKFCKERYISEVADRVGVFSPIYIYYPRTSGLLVEHHKNFGAMMNSYGFLYFTIEAVLPGQPFVATVGNNEPWHIQTTIRDKFYYRENLLNVAIKKTLDYDLYDFIFWIDAHELFTNLYWWEESIYKMCKFSSVQMFQGLDQLSPDNRTRTWGMMSVVYAYQFHRPLWGTFYWAGNAWGMTLDMYNKIGYILDTCIAGSCDYSFAIANMRKITDWDGVSRFPVYYSQLKPWISESQKLMGNGTFVRGAIDHLHEGVVFDYHGFQCALKKCCFDIKTDLVRDQHFMLHLKSDRMKRLFASPEKSRDKKGC